MLLSGCDASSCLTIKGTDRGAHREMGEHSSSAAGNHAGACKSMGCAPVASARAGHEGWCSFPEQAVSTLARSRNRNGGPQLCTDAMLGLHTAGQELTSPRSNVCNSAAFLLLCAHAACVLPKPLWPKSPSHMAPVSSSKCVTIPVSPCQVWQSPLGATRAHMFSASRELVHGSVPKGCYRA